MSTHGAAYAADAAVTTIGDGETVVLMLHGLGGDRNQPLGLLEGPPDPRLTIVAPDQRAHGETTVIGDAEDFRLDDLADDAAALLESRGLEGRPLIVAGISMGAAVALRLLQRAEHDLRGALLIRPAFETEPWPAHLQVFRHVAALLRSSGADGLETFVTTPAYRAVADVSAAGAQSLREQFTKDHAVERVVRLEHVPANPSIVWNDDWTPPCPVTVVGAEDDPVHPLATARLWHRRIAGARFEALPSRDRTPDEYRSRSISIARDAFAAWAA
jgi:pimeloyl-ACP methyl ester carboxylesterase